MDLLDTCNIVWYLLLLWSPFLTSISSSVLLLLTLFFLKETYEPVILRRRQQRRQRVRRAAESSTVERIDGVQMIPVVIEKQSITPDIAMVFTHAITRPFRFLRTSPILGIFGFFLAVCLHIHTRRGRKTYFLSSCTACSIFSSQLCLYCSEMPNAFQNCLIMGLGALELPSLIWVYALDYF